MRAAPIVIVAACAIAFVGSCKGDEHEHEHGHADIPACREISRACHAHDTGSGVAHDCHEPGHNATSEAECTARRAECLAACPANDRGPSTDGAAMTDAASD